MNGLAGEAVGPSAEQRAENVDVTHDDVPADAVEIDAGRNGRNRLFLYNFVRDYFGCSAGRMLVLGTDDGSEVLRGMSVAVGRKPE